MNRKDTRNLFIDLDRVRRWDNGIYQRFPKAEKMAITGLEPGGPGSCDARMASIYGSVLKEDGLYRMWYTVMPDALSHEEDPDHNYSAYAESEDGTHWHKPDLRITGQKRYPGNNLLSLPGGMMGVVSAPPATGAKYMAGVMCYGLEDDLSEGFGYESVRGTCLFVSDDGLHWRQLTREAIPQGDVACLFADPQSGRYLLYQKVGAMHGLDARRAFICLESTDGVHWEGYEGVGSWRESFVADDADDLQAMQSGFRIADHYGVGIYRAGSTYIAVENMFLIGSPLRFEFAQNPYGLWNFRLAYSHNGINWRRPRGRPTWLEPGAPGDWDAGFGVTGNTFLEDDDYLLMYYGGNRYMHGTGLELDFHMSRDVALEEQRDTSRVMLARIRKDRFASLAATYKGRVALDAGQRQGDTLYINALCPQGSVRVGVYERGKSSTLPGFSVEECIAFSGDSTRAAIQFRDVQWNQVPENMPLMLEFEITRGEIFGYEWR